MLSEVTGGAPGVRMLTSVAADIPPVTTPTGAWKNYPNTTTPVMAEELNERDAAINASIARYNSGEVSQAFLDNLADPASELGAALVAQLSTRSAVDSTFPTLAALGDSITAVNSPLSGPYRSWRESWVDMGVLLGDSRFDFLGASAYGGITIETARADYLPAVLAARPDYCLVTLGHNNYDGGVTTAERAALVDIWTQLRDGGITPIVVTCLPTSTDPLVIEFNTWIVATAEAMHLPVLDMWSAMVDPATGLYRAGEAKADGVHPTAVGAARMAQAFADWTALRFPTASGATARLVKAVVDPRPNGGNGLLLTNDGSFPQYWAGITAGSTAFETTDFGQRFVATKTSATERFQVNTAPITVAASTTYRFSTRVTADVLGAVGSWAIEVYDTNGYGLLGSVENMVIDVDDRTLSFRLATAAGTTQILPVLKVMGGPNTFDESGGVGASLGLSRITVEAI